VSITSDHIIRCAGREFELMCSTARIDFTADAAANANRLIEAGIDWQAFLASVERNYIAPLVYRSLKTINGASIPAKVLDTLRVRSKITAFKSEQLGAELIRLAQIFEAKGIRTIHYKGAVTAHEFYGAVSARSFNDLDFLIRPADLRAVVDILQEQGYTNLDQLTAAHFNHYVQEFKELVFRRGEIYLEPHWSLAGRRYRFDSDYEGFWKRSRLLSLRGSQLRVMSMADSLLVLCLVGAKGRWKRLQMITDIAGCVARFGDQDWHEVRARATATGTLRILHLGVLLAAELSGALVPAQLAQQARDSTTVRRLARDVAQTLAVGRKRTRFFPDSPSVFSPLLFRQREGFRDRWTYLWRTTTTADLYHLRRLPLPRLAHPLYRILVPLHDFVMYPAWRMGQALLARCAGNRASG
jgi:hypothetical protein